MGMGKSQTGEMAAAEQEESEERADVAMTAFPQPWVALGVRAAKGEKAATTRPRAGAQAATAGSVGTVGIIQVEAREREEELVATVARGEQQDLVVSVEEADKAVRAAWAVGRRLAM